jgi:hypothetical protein
VRISAERATVPSDGDVARVNAAWIVCVDVGGGGNESGLYGVRCDDGGLSAELTYSAKYQAPITPEHDTRKMPLATPQLHNQTTTVPPIAQSAHARIRHSSLPMLGKYPMRSRRNMSVRNGMERSRTARRMAGERARRKGFAKRSCVVKVNVEEAVWISRGRLTNRRAVNSERARGMREKIRRLETNGMIY